MTPEQVSQQVLDNEVREGLKRMGTLAAHILDGKLLETQRRAYAQGIDIQTKVVRDWILMRQSEIISSKMSHTEYAVGVRNTLADLESFLNEIEPHQPKSA